MLVTLVAMAGLGGQGRPSSLEEIENGIQGSTPAEEEAFFTHLNDKATDRVDQGDHKYKYWSKTEVRDEVVMLKRIVHELVISEFRHHVKVKQDIQGDRAMLKEDLIASQDKVAVLEGNTRTMAERMASALSNLKKAEEEEQRRLNLYKDHYDKDLYRIHAILSNQTLQLESDSASDLQKAYNEELKKIQDSVDGIMVGDRKKMQEADDQNKKDIDIVHQTLSRDVGLLTDFQSKISTGIKAAQETEGDNTGKLEVGQKTLQDTLNGLLSTLTTSQKGQQDLNAKTEANQALLKNLQDGLARAQASITGLAQKEDRENQALGQHLDAVTQSGSQLAEELKQQLATVTGLDDKVKAFAARDPAFKATVEGDHAALRSTIATLQAEIDKAQGIKGDLASLQTTLDGQIDGMLSKMDGLAATQTVQHSAGEQQESDITSMEARIAQLEVSAKAASTEAKTDHDEVAAALSAMQNKLSGLVSLKSDISALEDKVQTRVSGIQTALEALQASHNKTRSDADEKITGMEASLEAQIARTSKSSSNMTATMAAMSEAMHGLEGFKEESTKQQTELVKDMTDTTQSLGILDSKFSGKNVDIESRISGLEADINNVPTRQEFSDKIAAAAATADKAGVDLKTISDKMAGMQVSQDSNDSTLNKLSGDVDSQGKDTNDAWKEVKGKLSGEGDLFSFIANKLKDTDLQHKVATVFDRGDTK
mmetsp:Transcript_28059/g.67022  ORF Transcript_28059/g.67022 Transcript_28059/m.67022 type:complete len:710 (-) Transcript_28059:121-2250(-)